MDKKIFLTFSVVIMAQKGTILFFLLKHLILENWLFSKSDKWTLQKMTSSTIRDKICSDHAPVTLSMDDDLCSIHYRAWPGPDFPQGQGSRRGKSDPGRCDLTHSSCPTHSMFGALQRHINFSFPWTICLWPIVSNCGTLITKHLWVVN